MASILRVKLRWSGYQGGPGFSVFHFRDFDTGTDLAAQAQAAVARVDTFIDGIKLYVPAAVTMQAVSDVEEIEDTTGQLVSVTSAVPGSAETGGASVGANFAAAVGAVINWRTNGVRNGRRVRGKTFLVPLSSTAFEPNGTLASATITAFGTAATALLNPTGTPDLGVYARPSGPGATDGVWHVASSHSIPDMGAVLRSRRD